MSDASRFAVSTSLFRHARLDREHLVEIAAHGFDGIELWAEPAHFDGSDPAAVTQLREWLDDTRLTIVTVWVPAGEPRDEATWPEAFAPLLTLADRLPFPTLVVPLASFGPAAPAAAAADADALASLTGELAARGIRLALPVEANRRAAPEALVSRIESLHAGPALGVCLDVGQARLLGDPVDAIEAASGHIVAARLSDGRGRRPDPLVPYEGAVDWDHVLLGFQKVGYCGPWTLCLPAGDAPQQVLARAARARQRLEDSLGVTDDPYSS